MPLLWQARTYQSCVLHETEDISREVIVCVVQQEEKEDKNHLFYMKSGGHSQPLTVTVTIEDRAMSMEVDTGAAVSLTLEATVKEL